ncbi:unnamed protein product [Phytophthora fragariaefolia]|uniref:Unnamed protein product n=1 Tax=Phytophthora fragariaefolia TaxID=1490495 RepID=A0A9W6YLF6_9STRA|nr:unnamed protein product [Phytophthora fragariaefolia]
MPFGLMNAPSTFQRMMNGVLRGLTWTTCLVYLDDIVIYTRGSVQKHLVQLAAVLARLSAAGLSLKLKKCVFVARSMEYLGHELSSEGVRPVERLVTAVSEFPRPSNPVEVKRFVHLADYYRKFIEAFGSMMAQLTRLLKKDSKWQWTEEQEFAFERVKAALTTKPLLVYPDFKRPFRLVTDASGGVPYAGSGPRLTARRDLGAHVAENAEDEAKSEEDGLPPTEDVRAAEEYARRTAGQPQTVAVADVLAAATPGATPTESAAATATGGGKVTGGENRRHGPSGPAGDDDADSTAEGNGKRRWVSGGDGTSGRTTARQAATHGDRGATTVAPRDLGGAPRCSNVNGGGNDPDGHIDDEDDGGDGTEGGGGLYGSRPKDDNEDGGAARTNGGTANGVEDLDLSPTLQVTDDEIIRAQQRSQWVQRLVRAGKYQDMAVERHGGERYVIAALEYVTRYAVARSVVEHTAESVASFLMNEVVLRFGVFRELLTDGAPELTGHVIERLVDLLQARQTNPVPYRPQMIGLVERFHRTWKDCVATFMAGETQDDWSEWVQCAVYAYNSAKHPTVALTPNELMMGRLLRLPNELMRQTAVTEAGDLLPYHQRLVAALERGHECAERARVKEQARQARYYNRQAKQTRTFEPGDRVWVYNPPRGPKATKFVHIWMGPMRVLEPAGYENYVLRHEDRSRRPESIIAHASFMVSYHEPTSVLQQTAVDIEAECENGHADESESRGDDETTPAAVRAATSGRCSRPAGGVAKRGRRAVADERLRVVPGGVATSEAAKPRGAIHPGVWTSTRGRN